MIRAIYEANYTSAEKNENFLENPLIFHAKVRHTPLDPAGDSDHVYQVYAIGEKYGIPPLKSLAKTKTEAMLKDWTPTHFFDALNEVYESTIPEDRGLRDLYVQVAAEQNAALFKNKEFEETMDQNGQFWKDYSKELQEEFSKKEVVDLNTYKEMVCRKCQDYPRFMFTRESFNKSWINGSRTIWCPLCGRRV